MTAYCAGTSVGFIHIIPFDLGYVFFDILSPDNHKNLKCAEEFIATLSKKYSRFPNVEFNNSLVVNWENDVLKGFKCIDNRFAEDVICSVKLSQYLECLLLLNGTGILLLFDFEGRLSQLKGDNDPLFHPIYSLRKQKSFSQGAILFASEGSEILAYNIDLIHQFMNNCWQSISEVANKFKIKPVRSLSSNNNYKHNGLSYVLSIYLIPKWLRFSESELNYLLYAPSSNSAINVDDFKKLIEKFNSSLSKDEIFSVLTDNEEYIFSWSAVAAILSESCSSIEDVSKNQSLCGLIRSEVYIQSRWFIADNSLDNATKSFSNTTYGLRRIEGLIEYYLAGLENEISANMCTEENKILKNIIITSQVKELYKSVLTRIRAQRQLKETQREELKKRNELVFTICMAFVAVCSAYNTITDALDNVFQYKSILWLIVFILALVVAIGKLIFDNIKNK